MDSTERNAREVALPASALAGLRRTLSREAGPLATTHALHAAGYSAGSALHALFTGGTDHAGELGEEEFWKALGSFLSRRGWGTLRHERVHPAIGVLASRDGAEADPALEESQPSCAFTAGLLSSFLTHAAGGPIAVLEVACRSRGDEACRFAIGSGAAIHELYGKLLDETAFDAALAEL
jgi:predicted hydrocarbon binding protein